MTANSEDNSANLFEFPFGPLAGPFDFVYIHAMLFNTGSAVASINAISDVAAQLEAGGQADLDTEYVLDQIQNIVQQAAAISRYFWPVRSEYTYRGEYLRRAFSVSEQSALRSRDLRNALEHFDERIDDYLLTIRGGRFIPAFVGDERRNPKVPEHTFRAYYFDTGNFEMLGLRYPVPPLADEIARIHDLLVGFDEAGARFPRPPKSGKYPTDTK